MCVCISCALNEKSTVVDLNHFIFSLHILTAQTPSVFSTLSKILSPEHDMDHQQLLLSHTLQQQRGRHVGFLLESTPSPREQTVSCRNPAGFKCECGPRNPWWTMWTVLFLKNGTLGSCCIFPFGLKMYPLYLISS